MTCCLASMSWRSFRAWVDFHQGCCRAGRGAGGGLLLEAGARLGAQRTAGKGGDVIFAGGEPGPSGVVCDVIDWGEGRREGGVRALRAEKQGIQSVIGNTHNTRVERAASAFAKIHRGYQNSLS